MSANDDAWGTEAAATNGNPDGDTWGAANTDAAEVTETAPAVEMTKEERLQKAKDRGWTEATAFDYDEFQRTGGHDADYHGAAKVYEWSGDYGDVGPQVPELENILFGGEFQMRKGEHVEVLEVEVTLEGPSKVQPVAKVSYPLHTISLTSVDKIYLTFATVRRCGIAPSSPQEY
jgi:hypothetical protein